MKKKQISIGPGVSINLDKLMTGRLLLQATSGAGKSWLLRRLLEQSHGLCQQIVIDPEGEFSTLREKFDYVLAAKSGGDTLADVRTAKLLAERLLELGVSAIIDIYELNPDQRVKFVRAFLEAMVDAPKHLWHPVLVVLDEAHAFAPEKGKGEAESANAVKALCTRGRKRGFCAVLATQRLPTLDKDAAAMCANKLIGRASLDADIKRSGAELGMDAKDAIRQIRDLEDGEFYAFGPAISKTVTKVKVGPVETTHPQAGTQLAARVPPPTDKVKALLPKLSDLPAEAADRERTVSEMKKAIIDKDRQIKQLERERANATPNIPANIPAAKPVPALTDADRALIEKLTSAVNDQTVTLHSEVRQTEARLGNLVRAAVTECEQDLAKAVDASAAGLERLLDQVRVKKLLEKLNGLAIAPAPSRQISQIRDNPPARRPSTSPSPASFASRTPSAADGNGHHLPPGEHAVLTAALTYPDGIERHRLTVLTGYKRSTRDAYIVRLCAKGLIEVRGSEIVATPDGIAALPDFTPLPTGQALIDYWRARLPEGECKVLDVLLDTGGDTAREVIDESTGFKRSTRDAYLVRMRARGVVVDAGRGMVRASAELLEGR